MFKNYDQVKSNHTWGVYYTKNTCNSGQEFHMIKVKLMHPCCQSIQQLGKNGESHLVRNLSASNIRIWSLFPVASKRQATIGGSLYYITVCL